MFYDKIILRAMKEIIIKDINNVDLEKLEKETEKMSLSFDLPVYNEEAIYKMRKIYYFLKNKNLLEPNKRAFRILLMASRIGDQTFTLEELANFEKLNKKLDKRVVFTDNYYLNEESNYTLDMVKRTTEIVNKLADEIKGKNLSQVEQYVYACIKIFKKPYKDFVSTKENEDSYKEITTKFECKGNNTHLSRSLNGVCNTKFIVCAGYAYFLQAICKRLGIECYTQGVMVTKENGEKYAHRLNVVYLNDEKYNIKGWQVTDLTNMQYYDENGILQANLNYLLYPIHDIDKITPRDVSFYVNDANDTQNLFYSAQNELLDKGYLKSGNAYSMAYLKALTLGSYNRKYSVKTQDEYLSLDGKNDKEIEKEYKELIDDMKQNSKPINVDTLIEIYKNVINVANEEDLYYSLVKSIENSVYFAEDYSKEDVSLGFKKYYEIE